MKPIIDDREPRIRPGALPPKYGRALGLSLTGPKRYPKSRRLHHRRRQD